MPSNYTEHYQLNQWEPGDKVLRTDFNADNAKIDAALKAEADARSSAVASLAGQLAGKGNCRVETFTVYDDDDSATPVNIQFSAKPIAFLAIGSRGLVVWGRGMTYATGIYYTQYHAQLGGPMLTWSGNTASASRLNNYSESADTYTIVAFYAKD